MRKHGPALDDVLRTAEQAQAELRLVDDAEEDLRRLHAEFDAAQQAFTQACTQLTAARRTAAGRLAQDVSSQLPALGLADGRFLVALPPRDEPGATGAEDVEFRVALNAGHEARPLARVASGGELSRVMLALARTQAAQDAVPTLVFDEVDAGIGGRVGHQVGEALRALAAGHQVFAITHLAQLAARAHHHIVVEKGTADGVTSSDVRAVAGESRVAEVARMLGGDATSVTGRAHARELLEGVAPVPEIAAAPVVPTGKARSRKR
jgi:DNA repair protein RecN (Recombination protein N)